MLEKLHMSWYFLQVISGLAGALPDMDFVVNCIDEPRVLLGEGTAAERMHTSCRGASQVHSPVRLTNLPILILFYFWLHKLPQ